MPVKMRKIPKLSEHDHQKFWSRVKKSSGCWEWVGARDNNGYGIFPMRFKVGWLNIRSHRVSWAWKNGPIPRGLCICHRCDNKSCVRPSHLFLGTYRENAQDAVKKGLWPFGERGGASKLTERQVRKIIALSGTMTQTKLGEMFGVTGENIGMIQRGQTWKHLGLVQEPPQ